MTFSFAVDMRIREVRFLLWNIFRYPSATNGVVVVVLVLVLLVLLLFLVSRFSIRLCRFSADRN